MRIIAIPVAALTLTVLAACGTDGATAARPASPTTAPVAGSPAPTTKPTAAPPSAPATTPSETPTAKPTPSPTATPVHFDTPEAAMRYLADAYNHDDLAALKKVTNPTAREALAALRSEAVNLHLETCTRQDAGDYLCEFRHDYPPGVEPHDPAYYDGYGHAGFTVAPADAPGWYMTYVEYCG